MTIMLYVNNVIKSANFWESLGFEEVMRQDLGNGYETVLLMYTNTGAALQLYDIDFIRKAQPMLVDRKPVLLFSADYIDELFEKAQVISHNVSEIIPYGEQYAFTFADPDDNIFTLIGELVDRPATDEDLVKFDENVKMLTPLRFDQIDALNQPSYIFFGRRTCSWSRRLAREFPELTTSIYWVDTEGTDRTHPVRQKYTIETVPTVIKRASNGSYVKFDKNKQSIAQFVGEA